MRKKHLNDLSNYKGMATVWKPLHIKLHYNAANDLIKTEVSEEVFQEVFVYHWISR